MALDNEQNTSLIKNSTMLDLLWHEIQVTLKSDRKVDKIEKYLFRLPRKCLSECCNRGA